MQAREEHAAAVKAAMEERESREAAEEEARAKVRDGPRLLLIASDCFCSTSPSNAPRCDECSFGGGP